MATTTTTIQLQSATIDTAAALDAAASHSILKYCGHTPCLLPSTCLPSPVPMQAFNVTILLLSSLAHAPQAAKRLQPIFNKLIDRVSQDSEFLQRTLFSAGVNDDFTSRLLDLHAASLPFRANTAPRFGLIRNDFMFHGDDLAHAVAKQVEINTISVAFAMLASRMTRLHREALLQQGFDASLLDSHLPPNPTESIIPQAFSAAMQAYIAQLPGRPTRTPVVLMITQENESNTVDQRLLASALVANYGIRTVRMSLSAVARFARIDPLDHRLIITTNDNEEEVGIVYFRAGYSPSDYATESAWDARLLMEISIAIKCPDIAQHLAGTKKVQQALAQPGVLERFLPTDEAAQVRAMFVGLYSLDADDYPDKDDGLNKLLERVYFEPSKFVLKPQREGGGNNFYGPDVARVLSSLSSEDRKAFILMDTIEAPRVAAVLLDDGRVVHSQVTTELGFYGVFLSNPCSDILNCYAGHLLWAQPPQSELCGRGFLDSPLLI